MENGVVKLLVLLCVVGFLICRTPGFRSRCRLPSLADLLTPHARLLASPTTHEVPLVVAFCWLVV
eukprot:454521-Amphidinium_carterae.1